MTARLAVAGLGHAYALKTVLDDIDLTLDAGRVMALVGPSGCGKTTLLHLCAGLLPVQRGRLDNGFARPAVMFQQPRLLPWKTARDNIALGLKAAGMALAERNRRSEAIAQAVGLDELALDQFPHALSGGMQSRAALARALVLAPDLLLMDEPFAALDIGLKGQLHRLLLDHQREHGLAVLMITHDLMEAVRLADTILVMAPEPGRIVHRFVLPTPACDRDEAHTYHTTAELLKVPAVRESFGMEALPSAPAGLSDAAPLRLISAAADLPGGKTLKPWKAKKAFSC
ncbi:ATP-binding cassette domain-containing protein [Aromatoleum sp.]|uniref:ATP-binding cassette domain-containing protein n=1 Tax=Aromatoleum sp. TaxID=2307007 RepID=UPI002FC599EE